MRPRKRPPPSPKTGVSLLALNNPLGRIDPDGQKDKPFNFFTDKGVNWDPPGATPNYNCHSYAWNNREGVVLNPTKKVEKATQLDSNAPNQNGDRVIYFVDKNNDGVWQKGETIVHSAVVTKVDSEGNTVEVTAKLGKRGVATNHPDAPEYYKKEHVTSGKDTKRAYFRLPQEQSTEQPTAPPPVTAQPQTPSEQQDPCSKQSQPQVQTQSPTQQ